ncbi:MAG: D-alanine--D-alanine ligase [Spirochaetaceae bacterium]|jgi:D-alanine-D-alanine ligase|nr:D-alanine--D-alanine ligase [Spirochaetaceae bacterium]
MAKLKVGILFGGRSAEHEVSLQSAKNIFEAIDRSKFEPVLIGIDKSGKWLFENAESFLLNSADPKKIKLNPEGAHVAIVPQSGGAVSQLESSAQDGKNGEKFSVDVVFPILHGPFGEDGTVQGLLKLADIPFVGASVLGSAIGMDKDVMKRLLREAGLPIGKYRVLHYYEALPAFKDIAAELGAPLFVKPANMGSSVGVQKIHNEAEYGAFTKDAFNYDTKIVLEEFIAGREIECAVLGNEQPVASIPGEVKPTHEFYSYDAKYIDENGADLEVPAKLPADKVNEVQELAVKTYKVLCCEGLSRVDFFLTHDGKFFVNEINTMPGFTKISMYPKLFAAADISYTCLITRLIELAIARFEKEKTLKTSYLS